MDVSAVEDQLGTGPRGLTEAEASARLSVHGFNQLEEEPPPPPLVVFFRQFRSPLIFILLVAMAVTLILAEYLDAVVIGNQMTVEEVWTFGRRFSLVGEGSSGEFVGGDERIPADQHRALRLALLTG